MILLYFLNFLRGMETASLPPNFSVVLDFLNFLRGMETNSASS